MGSILSAVLPHIGHVTVDAGHPGVGVNTVLPRLIIRMLGFQHGRLGIRVDPIVLEAPRLPRLIILILPFRRESIIPRRHHPAVFLGEVILTVALAADVAPHIVVGHLFDVDPLPGQGLHQALLIDAQRHRVRIVTGRTSDPFVVLDGSHDLVDGLGSVGPAALLKVHVVHVRTLAGDTASLLPRQALRILEVHAGISMSPIVIILDSELIAFEIFQHLRLFHQMGIFRLGASITRRRGGQVVILHVGIVLQRISVPIGVSPQPFLRRHLSQPHAVVLRRSGDTEHDEAEEQKADRHYSGQYFLQLIQLLSPLQ